MATAELSLDEDFASSAEEHLVLTKQRYLGTLAFIERLHRLLLDVVKDEFERLGRVDINSVQALLLFNIGEEELTAGELKTRGYYQGSNVSYNLKKLVELGYLHHERCTADRRSVRIRLTEKGDEVRKIVDGIYRRHVASFVSNPEFDGESLAQMNDAMGRLERFWREQIRYIY
ncbi:MAG: winged helix DNA-binding protein [Pseudomonadota bacterium]